MSLTINDIPKLCTLYTIEGNSICYGDILKKRPTKMCFNIEMLDSKIIMEDGSIQSALIEKLIPTSLGELQQVYHLASIINKKHPGVDWDWLNQFYDAEKRERFYRYKMDFLQSKGRSTKSSMFTSDYEAIDFDVAYDKYVKECETDESLLHKTRERLKHWVFY